MTDEALYEAFLKRHPEYNGVGVLTPEGYAAKLCSDLVELENERIKEAVQTYIKWGI